MRGSYQAEYAWRCMCDRCTALPRSSFRLSMVTGILAVDAQTTSARAHSRDAGVLGWRQTRRAAHSALPQLWSGVLLSPSVLPALLVEGHRVVHGERPRNAPHLRHQSPAGA